MNIETLRARVVLLQQNVEIQSQQITSLVDNLKVLQGHLAESKHWLNQLEGDNNAIEEGNQPENNLCEHQDGESSGEATEPSSGDCVEQSGQEQQQEG